MYGKFSPTLSYDPQNSNKLIVKGPLVAQTNADLTTVVKIKAELWPDGGENNKLECSTNGSGICPLNNPGATWTMDASTTLHGPVNGHARAFDSHNNVVAEWFQPALPGEPKILIS
jgi:hypothetical protein